MLDAPTFFVKSVKPEDQRSKIKTLIQNHDIKDRWIVVWGKQRDSIILCRRLMLAINFPEGYGFSVREQNKLPKPRGIVLEEAGSFYIQYEQRKQRKRPRK